MSRLLGHRPSPAMVVAMLALFIAFAGTGYAAVKLPANSVGTKQIKASAVTSKKIAHDAVSGSKVRAHSLTGSDINLGRLGKVPTAGAADLAARAMTATHADSATNAAHADSATNATHASSADSATTAATAAALASVAYRVDTSAGPVTVPACGNNPCTPDQVGTSFAIARCPAGTVAIGGGGVTADAGVELSGSFPVTVAGASAPNAWEVDVDNWRQIASSVDYFVVCATANTADDVVVASLPPDEKLHVLEHRRRLERREED
jgi:hypothetical protein